MWWLVLSKTVILCLINHVNDITLWYLKYRLHDGNTVTDNSAQQNKWYFTQNIDSNCIIELQNTTQKNVCGTKIVFTVHSIKCHATPINKLHNKKDTFLIWNGCSHEASCWKFVTALTCTVLMLTISDNCFPYASVCIIQHLWQTMYTNLATDKLNNNCHYTAFTAKYGGV